MTANILIVDDLDTNIKVLEAKLLNEYYIVYTAKSAEEAYEVLRNSKIDVILLDCMMPEIDGFEACRTIKSSIDTMHIPVVIVTALTDVQDRIKGLEAGADEFLTKPVDDNALFARLRSLTNMKNVIDELKLRNETNTQLGAPSSKINYDFERSKILIINDDPVESRNLIQKMSNITSNIKVAESQNQMNKVLSKHFIPDAIIISCQMEEEDPLRILTSLSKTNEYTKNASKMMLAEEDHMQIVLRSLELGASDYFISPIDSNELTARIKTQLQRKYYTDTLRSSIDLGMSASIRDAGSGLFNRRYFDTHLPNLIERAQLSNKNLCAMMIDIDNFKSINDKHGHQIGDEVIKVFGCILLNNIPFTDLCARYGGEEFVAIIYDPTEDSRIIAEKIRKSVENSKDSIPFTVSIGITCLKKEDNISQFICRADEALYKAKNQGRNLVRIS